MTRRKQNCPKRMKWEGGEGEEPPEDVQDDEEGDEEDDDVSRHSSECTDVIPNSRIPSPITTVLQEDCNTHPVDLANNELLSNIGEEIAKDSSQHTRRQSPTTPPPPILERCLSGESSASGGGDESIPSVFQPVPPRLATMVSASSPLISSSSSPPLLLPVMMPATTPPPRPSSLKSSLLPLTAVATENNAVLDFSTKKRTDENASPVLNLSKSAPTSNDSGGFVGNGPLDLSLGSTKKRELEDSPVSNAHKKPARMPPASPWTSPLLTYQLPYFATGGVPSLMHPKGNNAVGLANNVHSLDPSTWNGKAAKHSEKSPFSLSMAPSDASKALEKMSELSKLGVVDEFRPTIPLSPSVGSGGGGGGRHSAWQSHWLNKGADQAKDVLKCVWCKQSFPSLAAMTTHMQEAKHCGVAMSGVSSLHQSMSAISGPGQTITTPTSVSSSSVGSSKSSSSDLNLLIKETMPLPRKLVRGQDVWLGKGAEQTRQILKCMWCGQSFRSLAEMTSHMQQTQHYTNIISQEQIISWKSSEDKPGGGGGSNSGNPPSGGGGGTSSGVNSSSTNSHVSAVLTCKVCDQAFSSLKDLSNHMMKNSHYKEHIMRSITESGGRRRQTREKRKKSLPVRKLLELERAQNELKNGGDNMMMTMMMMGGGGAGVGGGVGGGKSTLHSSSSNRITCEKCGDKIDMSVLVDHLRICVGASTDDKKNLLKSALMSYNNSEAFSENSKSTREPPSTYHRLSPKTEPNHHPSKDNNSAATTPNKETSKSPSSSSTSSSPSVLNAIEKLIEKSFDPRSRHAVSGGVGYSANSPGSSTSPIGSSILKRLGIDESVDYTKPLMDVNMQAAKAYALGSQYHNSHYDANYFAAAAAAAGRRERSGSESSSVSERGSNGRRESTTPDGRKIDRNSDRTPRTTPEKRISTPPAVVKTEPKEVEPKREPQESIDGDEAEKEIKEEPDTDKEDADSKKDVSERKSSVDSCRATPKSIPEEDVGEDLSSGSRRHRSSPLAASPASRSIADRASVSPRTNITGSPTSSERSITPRSSSDKKSSGSLGALSSMFDSLSGTNTSPASSEAPAQSNKASNHPLAALQKLCDKTETHHHAGNSGTGSSRSAASSAAGGSHSSSAASASQSSSTPGAILAFSWACNDAVVTDSIMKCAFCDTPFISKGAYRHHLSKMHFVKDGVIPEPVPLKSPTGGGLPAAAHNSSSLPTSLVKNSSAASAATAENNNCKTGGSVSVSSSLSSIKSPQSQSAFDESPHSKFLKYTELAKQLSSKYV